MQQQHVVLAGATLTQLPLPFAQQCAVASTLRSWHPCSCPLKRVGRIRVFMPCVSAFFKGNMEFMAQMSDAVQTYS
eukprot:1157247-Pelagomonas_calceolata.AAC.19